jgi:hypothetical protein
VPAAEQQAARLVHEAVALELPAWVPHATTAPRMAATVASVIERIMNVPRSGSRRRIVRRVRGGWLRSMQRVACRVERACASG